MKIKATKAADKARRAAELFRNRAGMQRAINAIHIEINGVERQIRELDPTLALGRGLRGQCDHCSEPCCEDCHGEHCPSCGEQWSDEFSQAEMERELYR